MNADFLAPLRSIAKADPGRIALRSMDRAPSNFSDLLGILDGAAAELAECGVGTRSRVATILPNSPETAVAVMAVASVGACIPLNPAYAVAEMERLIAASGVTHLVTASDNQAAIQLAQNLGVPLIEMTRLAQGPTGALSLQLPGARQRAGAERFVDADSDRIALVLHTSGSSGLPKRVPLTVGNLAASARNIAASLHLGASDVCFNMMPMFHIGALVDLMLGPLGAGGAVAFADDISADAFFAGLSRFEPTWFQAVPTVLRDILSRAGATSDAFAPGRLRLVRAVSQPLPPQLHAEFEARFSVPVVPIYGMTETAGLIASMPLDQTRPGSVGKGFGSAVSIADARGNEMPSGKRGEILVSGPNVMSGYEGVDAPAEVFRGRWFRTGDEGYIDAEGFLFITGRLKDVINRGGEKISPAEIDLVLADYPGIREAAAFPQPHPTLGEEVAVAVVSAPGSALAEPEITAFLRDRLAAFKVPRQVYFLDSLPRVPSGKLDRRALPGLVADRRQKRRRVPETPLARSLAGLWRRVLEVPDVAMDDDFFDLGGDSLTATTLAVLLEERFGRDLPIAEMFEHPTVAQMEELLGRRAAVSGGGTVLDPTIYASLQRITAGWQGKRLPRSLVVGRNTIGSRTPFFWVPQSLHGFEALARCLDAERPLYAMASLSLTRMKSGANTIQLARYYAGEILRIQPSGPFLIGGFCQGAVVAFQIAKALRALGHEVALLCLQDRFIPEPYDGNIAIFSGRRGSFCPYYLNHEPERAWAKYYSGEVSLFGAGVDHDQLHNSPHVEAFARDLELAFARVEAGQPAGRRLELSSASRVDPRSLRFAIDAKLPLFMRQGSTRTIKVSVANRSSLAWGPTRQSGLVIVSRWRVANGSNGYVLDGRAEIPGIVRPGDKLTVGLPIRVPMSGLPMFLDIELVEDGFYLGERLGPAGFRRLVLPRRPSFGAMDVTISAS